jgi:hypothetical protein
MKQSDFKKIIKEAVKEAIQEELKDILLEAVRQPKTIITEGTYYPQSTAGVSTSGITGGITSIPGVSTSGLGLSSRQAIMGMLDDMKTGTAKFTTNNLQYNPPPANTIGEGSKLPDGEVGLDQIMGLMK